MAECLADRLSYPLLGREVVQAAAAELGVPAQLVEEKMQNRPSLWDRFSSMRWTYIVAVQAALWEKAVAGNLVYHGLAGGLLLRGAPCLLCLRLIAPMDRRIQSVMAESGMDAAMADRFIRDIDESRARWVKALYGEDIMDPALYDLVINLETLTVGGACALTASVIEQPGFELSDGVRASLEDLRLASRVKLSLVADPELRPLKLDARADRGVVSIFGQVPLRQGGRTGDRIAERARSIAGVEKVRLQVEWYDPYP
jgi:cytidylate kinase